MSIDYYQYCFIGVKIPIKDIKVVDSEAVYELQNRYCTRTGTVKTTKKILVRDEQFHYKLDGKLYKYIEDIQKAYPDLDYYYNQNCIFIGKSIKNKDFGNVNLINKSLSLLRINEIANEVRQYFPNMEIQLHLFHIIN